MLVHSCYCILCQIRLWIYEHCGLCMCLIGNLDLRLHACCPQPQHPKRVATIWTNFPKSVPFLLFECTRDSQLHTKSPTHNKRALIRKGAQGCARDTATAPSPCFLECGHVPSARLSLRSRLCLLAFSLHLCGRKMPIVLPSYRPFM